MPRLTLTFSDQEADELLRLSHEERRRPHDMATLLVAEGLQRRRQTMPSQTASSTSSTKRLAPARPPGNRMAAEGESATGREVRDGVA